MTEVAEKYSITGVEICGSAINIASFAHLKKKVDFNPIINHLVLINIIKVTRTSY